MLLVQYDAWHSIISNKPVDQSYLPKVVTPLPALSNSRKATMKRESGAHSTDSNATNSGKEINLMGKRMAERRKTGKIVKYW